MQRTYTNLTFTFRGTEAEQNEAVSKKAEEYGFNRFYRYEFGNTWRKQDGTEVSEDFFENGNKRLQITCLNPSKKEARDEQQFQLSINHD